MLSVPDKKCFATIAQAKCVFALIDDLLPLDWCHIQDTRYKIQDTRYKIQDSLFQANCP